MIEDDPLYSQTLRNLVAVDQGSFLFEAVDSLQSGLDRLSEGGIDLVLLDLSLPDSNSLTGLRRLRKYFSQIPVIIMTACDDDEIALRSVMAGAQDYLVKGEIDYQLLRRSMRYAIERHCSEMALRESQSTLQLIADSTPEIIALFDLKDWGLIYVNRQVQKILGYSPDDLQRLALSSLIHPDDIAQLTESFRAAQTMELGEVTEVTHRIRHANGEWRFLSSEITIFLREEESQALQLLVTSHDVTERKLSEEALRRSEDRYRDLVENSGLMIGTHDMAGRFLSANQSTIRFCGLEKPEELVGRRISDFAAPEVRPHFDSYLENIRVNHHAVGTMIAIRTDGEERILEYDNSVRRDDSAEPIVRFIASDITERKRYEEKLQEQVELLNCAQDAIMVQDLEGRIVFWNKAAERIYGWEAQEVIGARIAHRISVETREGGEWRAAIWQSILESGEWMGEAEHLTKDRRTITVVSRCTLMRDSEGKPRSVLVINTEITEKKMLEAQFLRMQRMESLGALASGIAHDLNNWLAPIMMALHTLQQRFTDANSQKWLNLIRKSTERSRDLIDQVLTFAKGAAGERVPLKTSHFITEAAKIVEEIIPHKISLEVDLSEDLWSIIGDATQIHQVMMNLCINARDSMPLGGRLLITASNTILSEADAWMASHINPGKFVRISVIDSGIGMAPELIDRIFEPFFTTKVNGLGSGLGLSTALGIVRSHGGFINVTSSVGKGSEFRVYLPASDREPEPPCEDKEENLLDGGGELILVVDDEQDMREVTRATLESSGYRTLGAENIEEALALFARHEDEIKLVLTNLAAPNFDGISLGVALRQLNPQIRIIVTSGLPTRDQIEAANQAGIRTILCKPYTAKELLNAMAKCLN